MRRIYNNDYYIQVFDVLFLEELGIYNIPKTVWDKIFYDEKILNDMEKNIFIKLDSDEEIAFFKYVDIIFLLNELEEMSCEDLDNISSKLSNRLDELKRSYNNDKNLTPEERKQIDIEIDITNYKIRTISDYRKSRASQDVNIKKLGN